MKQLIIVRTPELGETKEHELSEACEKLMADFSFIVITHPDYTDITFEYPNNHNSAEMVDEADIQNIQGRIALKPSPSLHVEDILTRV